jgi:fructokinase
MMNPCVNSDFAQVSGRRRVVGSGLIALDVLLNENSSTLSSALGGSAGNVLAILAHLGWSSVPVAKVGMDSAAELIRREFEDLRADVQFLVGEDHSCTPIVFQLPGNEEGTHRFTFSCPHCGRKRHFSYSSDDRLGTPVLSKIKNSDVYYFDRVTSLSLKLAEDYRSRGALVMFEPSSVGNDVKAFERALSAAHLIKYADDRIVDLQAFDLSGVAIEIQTLGKKGLKFRSPSSGNSWISLSAYPAQYVADTSGAGDWCTAGMLYSLFAAAPGQSVNDFTSANLSEALRFGQALAALNCGYAGARGLARRQRAYEILEMATELQSMSSIHFRDREPKGQQRSSIENYQFSIEDSSEGYRKLCCDGLAL